jgi:NTP pyrophosphatase (non-canonical NTP hydrolase)
MTDGQTTLAELRALVAEFVAERDWQKFHDAKNLAMAIAVEAAELMEHFQWARTDELPDLTLQAETRRGAEEEIADVMCFLLALCNALDLDLSAAVERKMSKNRAKYPPEDYRGRYFKPKPRG